MTLHQQWEIKEGTGIITTSKGVQLLSGKARFLPPRQWERWYLPWKLEVEGGVTVASCFQRPEVVSGALLTTGGMLRLDVYNASDKVIRITPKTPLVSLHGHEKLEVVRMARVSAAGVEVTAAALRQELAEKFPAVSDLSTHPVLPAMEPLRVRADEVWWSPPQEQGRRTSYRTEDAACRHKVGKQLEEYVKRGYLRMVSCGERVALSPLYPIQKKDGTYRFTNDFRWLNAHFRRAGMAQVDVWRRLWSVDPSWVYFAKLDLKDGFFAIPVDEELQAAFAFTWEDRRYAWLRIPQGWTWSPILFSERVAEIVDGLGTVQFVDDLLVGATTKGELRQKVLEVFARFARFGLKVNLAKTELLVTKVKFLGLEITHGTWTLAQYFRDRVQQLGEVEHWKDLERLIGVLSYLRRTVVGMERLLAPLRQLYADARHSARTGAWWQEAKAEVWQVLMRVLDRQVLLALPGSAAPQYVLETDWSGEHAGYLLWARTQQVQHLVDLGSKRIVEATSSFLGELKAVVWACKTTKALRGDAPLLIRTDNQALAEQLDTNRAGWKDKRVMRLCGWLLGNEDFQVDFLPGSENAGADLLSRPRKRPVTCSAVQVEPTKRQRKAIEQAHAGHWNWETTLQNLKARGSQWPGMAAQVKQFVLDCDRCRAYGKPVQRPTWGQWDCPSPNDTVFCDFLGPLQWPDETITVHVLVIVDGFSRYVVLTCADGPTTDAAKRGLWKWFRRVGKPRRLVSDQGPAFISGDFVEFCARHRIELCHVPPYAPWSNGLAERTVGTVLGRIRRAGPGTRWPTLVAQVERNYNRSHHSGIAAAPEVVMMGKGLDGEELQAEAWAAIKARAARTTEDQRRRRKARHELSGQVRRALQEGDRVAIRAHHPQNKLDRQWIDGGYRIGVAHGPRIFEVVDGDGGYVATMHAHQLKLLEPAVAR